MNRFAKGLFEAWLHDTVKSYSAQSDIDHQDLKRLKAENEQLNQRLMNAEELYNISVRDREILIARNQALKSQIVTGVKQVKVIDNPKLEKKYNELLMDCAKLIELQMMYMAFFNANSKDEYNSFKSAFKKKHGI